MRFIINLWWECGFFIFLVLLTHTAGWLHTGTKASEEKGDLFLGIISIQTDLTRFFIQLVCMVGVSAETDLIQNRGRSARMCAGKTS